MKGIAHIALATLLERHGAQEVETDRHLLHRQAPDRAPSPSQPRRRYRFMESDLGWVTVSTKAPPRAESPAQPN